MKLDKRERYAILAGKWLSGNMTTMEEAEFDEWYNKYPAELIEIDVNYAISEKALKEKILRRIMKKSGIKRDKH